MTNSYRIAIVGAASIRGKQLNEALAESSFVASEFLLMDDQEALGQLETVGDEITFIQPVAADSFEHVDFTFFAVSLSSPSFIGVRPSELVPASSIYPAESKPSRACWYVLRGCTKPWVKRRRKAVRRSCKPRPSSRLIPQP